MNMLEGEIQGRQAIVGDLKLAAPDLPETVADGTKVTIGLRPEDIVVADARDRSLTADVEFVEELGATRLLHGRFAGQPIIMQVQTAHAAQGSGKVGFSVPSSAVHVFDATTGSRLNG
eukprot:gene55197-73737_t